IILDTATDPCMGSGHILVYAFDVLMQIYLSQGYTERDAASRIIEKNLYGADIDKRAYQLSYFALMMKARQYDRRFLTREDKIKPNLCNLQDLAKINPANLPGELRLFAKQFENCDTYGSLIEVQPFDTEKISALIEDYEENLETLGYRDILEKMLDAYRIFAQKYDVVCTNPPYMGSSNMNAKLSDFVKKNYEDYKSDLFSASIVRCTLLTKSSGYLGFLSPYVWMFIQSYEKLRNYFYLSKTIETLIQFEYSAFEEATVPICTFVLKNSRVKKNGVYLRLTDFRGGMEVQRQKTLEAIADHNCGFYYEANSENFSKIPGAPVAYWVSENFINIFDNENVYSVAEAQEGLKTGDNERFIREWYEVSYIKTNMYSNNNAKWFFHTKGGDFRKWYGNMNEVLNYENNGAELRAYKGSCLAGLQNYFKENITYNRISSSKTSFRYTIENSIPNMAGLALYVKDPNNINYVLAWLNSEIITMVLSIVNPTLNFPPGTIGRLPIKVDELQKPKINLLVQENIALSKTDWDSFETSWDFAEHPLVRLQKGLWDATATGAAMQAYYGEHIKVSCPVELCYMLWQGECNRRFNQLKENEEELNRIFIDIYGLQDELTPEVEDKDVTVRRADLTRDIKSLISYAVGCMFGRYSLDVEGLAYAGGEWDDSKYRTFIPDDDNCIPITDEEYFKDDIVVRFVEFVRTVYGADTLEQNLNYIADALGTKGNTSR
ncbi:MAG: BREX-1 system adenine-specific DNA-methyltransferase PglX, partial [Oscillospiraceae bacterium]